MRVVVVPRCDPLSCHHHHGCDGVGRRVQPRIFVAKPCRIMRASRSSLNSSYTATLDRIVHAPRLQRYVARVPFFSGCNVRCAIDDTAFFLMRFAVCVASRRRILHRPSNPLVFCPERVWYRVSMCTGNLLVCFRWPCFASTQTFPSEGTGRSRTPARGQFTLPCRVP